MAQLRPRTRVSCSFAPYDSPRDTENDFYCLRYRVWYPSIDCAYRTLHRTCPGCDDCEQGLFNLKRHRSELARHGPCRGHGA